MAPEAKIDTITDALRRRILEGEFGTAGRLPSLRLLATEYRTTHETMNKAVQRLQAEGVLTSFGRAGVFIGRPRMRVGGIATPLDPHLQELGFSYVESNLEEPALVPASADVAKMLGVAQSADVIRRLRIQGTSDMPYRIIESFYPVSLAGGAIFESMKNDASFDVLLAIEQTHGKGVKWVHEDAMGRLPTGQEQEALKINRHAPVLEGLRFLYTGDEKQAIASERIIGVASLFVLSYDYATIKE